MVCGQIFVTVEDSRMNRLFPAGVLFASIAALAGPVSGQSSSTLNPLSDKFCSGAFGDTLSLYTPGKPLVATYAIWHSDTTTQERDDGAHAAPEVVFVKVARNSSGKVYTEYWGNGVPNHKFWVRAPGHDFWVENPVSGTSFDWS